MLDRDQFRALVEHCAAREIVNGRELATLPRDNPYRKEHMILSGRLAAANINKAIRYGGTRHAIMQEVDRRLIAKGLPTIGYGQLHLLNS